MLFALSFFLSVGLFCFLYVSLTLCLCVCLCAYFFDPNFIAVAQVISSSRQFFLTSYKKANLEMNKEGLATELVCLLDERSKPRNWARFQEQMERFFYRRCRKNQSHSKGHGLG